MLAQLRSRSPILVALFFWSLNDRGWILALLLSGSAGFTQLGVLIAIGISFAGLFMTTVFFLFSRAKRRHDWRLDFTLAKNYVRWCVRRPAAMLAISTPLLVLLTAIAVSPRPSCPSMRARARWNQNIATPGMRSKRSCAKCRRDGNRCLVLCARATRATARLLAGG